MGNSMKASHEHRLDAIDMYEQGPKAFMKWVKLMYMGVYHHFIVKALRFGNNTKMKDNAKEVGLTLTGVVNFNMPSGWTCPKANICKTFADRITGTIRNVGPIECYEARSERQYPVTRRNAWMNYYVIKTLVNLGVHAWEIGRFIFDAWEEQFPGSKFIRIHAGGDFFSDRYFEAVNELATLLPTDRKIFGYTKVFKYITADRFDNFRLVYSWGGLDDDLAKQALDDGVKFGSCEIIFDADQANGRPIACTKDNPGDDIRFILAEVHFCLFIH